MLFATVIRTHAQPRDDASRRLRLQTGRPVRGHRHSCLLRSARSRRTRDGGARCATRVVAHGWRDRHGAGHLVDALHRDAGVQPAGSHPVQLAHRAAVAPGCDARLRGGVAGGEPADDGPRERRRGKPRDGRRHRRHALHRDGRHASDRPVAVQRAARDALGCGGHRHLVRGALTGLPASRRAQIQPLAQEHQRAGHGGGYSHDALRGHGSGQFFELHGRAGPVTRGERVLARDGGYRLRHDDGPGDCRPHVGRRSSILRSSDGARIVDGAVPHPIRAKPGRRLSNDPRRPHSPVQ